MAATVLYTIQVSDPDHGLICPSEPIVVRQLTGDRLAVGEAALLEDFGIAIPDKELVFRDADDRLFERRVVTTDPDNDGTAYTVWRRVR